MTDAEQIDALKALAHPLRLQILQSLQGRERNVGEIEQATGIGQPALSQQLGVLRKAGLVDTRKEAKLVYYNLNPKRLSALAEIVGGLAGVAAGPATKERPRSPGVANFARLS
ncbi:helix-turn-helix transcriptional regulator [Erythrobacter sp. HKB08]|uniref:ArsR/SmtB family transcription factor n=1 Tax=Erythrobacter sp. HKB08 TaxID=2502843 RepID=UPI001008B60D|nr:metalloregulator ArsR/SmtB family transcription factor [Erythrobacter sp. HKB08]